MAIIKMSSFVIINVLPVWAVSRRAQYSLVVCSSLLQTIKQSYAESHQVLNCRPLSNTLKFSVLHVCYYFVVQTTSRVTQELKVCFFNIPLSHRSGRLYWTIPDYSEHLNTTSV